MNRYVAEGLIHEAAAGKQVVVVTRVQHDVPRVLDEFAQLSVADHLAITRTNGAERIRLDVSPGTVRVVPVSRIDSLRGTGADVVFLEPDVEREIHQRSDAWVQIEHLHSLVATAVGDPIVRA